MFSNINAFDNEWSRWGDLPSGLIASLERNAAGRGRASGRRSFQPAKVHAVRRARVTAAGRQASRRSIDDDVSKHRAAAHARDRLFSNDVDAALVVELHVRIWP